MTILINSILTENCIRDECRCGRPAIPPGVTIVNTFNNSSGEQNTVYEHKSKVYYECIDKNNILVGSDVRVCDNGYWTGIVPRCGKDLFFLSSR